jgi:hypothetical protein
MPYHAESGGWWNSQQALMAGAGGDDEGLRILNPFRVSG